MSTFRLRPITSPSASSSQSSPLARSHCLPPSSSSASAQSGPTSNSSPLELRDLDLSFTHRRPMLPMPQPHSGHELMAFFPPTPPVLNPWAKQPSGSTSEWFKDQERQFFAARVEKKRESPKVQNERPPPPPPPRGWQPPLSPQECHKSHQTRSSPPRRVASAPYPPPTHNHPTQHSSRSRQPVPQRASSRQPPEESTEGDSDADDSWRTPIPFSERRRAGKHTKRVVKR